MALEQVAASAGHDDLVKLAEAARSLDVRTFEECDTPECRASLVPKVSALLKRASEVVAAIGERFDDPSAPPPPVGSLRESLRPVRSGPAPQGPQSHVPSVPPERRSRHFHAQMDALVGDVSRGPGLVADIAFVASMELREKHAQLTRVAARQGADHWELVEACASARRRILKSATAVELVLCEVERCAPSLDYRSELTVALEVRRRYTGLRRTIAPQEPPSEDVLVARLRVIGTRIAMLVGLEIYPDLRLRDRVQIRDLQTRILTWLGGAQDPREGMRLWGDLVGFADLIAQVSKRQELREHDTALAGRLLPRLDEAASDGEIDADDYERLRALQGVSSDIDELLDRDERRVRSWRGPLQHVLAGSALSAASGPGAANPWLPWGHDAAEGGKR